MHRHTRTSFGASYVFPGGLLEADDRSAHAFSGDFAPDAADRCLALPSGGLDYYSAATRELFEETGVLLARERGSGRWFACSAGRQAIETARASLNSGEMRWSEFLGRHDLALACELLHYFAYWITPRSRPKRFSTRFFLGRMPEGQEAMHDGHELTDSRWTTAAAAIAAHEARELRLPPPTLATLKDIARFRDIDELLGWARQCSESGVRRILPAIVSAGGGERIVMPGHADYPADADGGEQ